ncbi:hypothetical protein PHET_12360 [Paragonimus heterotremus]|uniref:Uncharacterized protein n=1 Tax=Paragonimus heterotremus TaxID=100268 RepID=A0A8J4WKT3_9TREM|nr:hypothetical protein PHET_12360 [Paragonimus heterotremus]
MGKFGNLSHMSVCVGRPTAKDLPLYCGTCQTVFSFITLLVCSSYYAFSSDVFETQLKERIVSDVITIVASSSVFLAASESTNLIRKLCASVIRIVLFVDITSSAAAILMDQMKIESIAVLSWTCKSDFLKISYMSSNNCCGLNTPYVDHLLYGDAALCISALNDSFFCCGPDMDSDICVRQQSCFSHLINSVRQSVYLASGLGFFASFLKISSYFYRNLTNL